MPSIDVGATHTVHSHTHGCVWLLMRLLCVQQRNMTWLYEFLLASNPIYRELHHFQQGCRLFIRSDQPCCTIHPPPDPIFILPSFLCALCGGGGGVGFFFFWGMVWLIRCGSDTESVLLLLISTVAERRRADGGGAAGSRGVGAKADGWQEGKGRSCRLFLGTWFLRRLWCRWFVMTDHFPRFTLYVYIDFLPFRQLLVLTYFSMRWISLEETWKLFEGGHLLQGAEFWL